MTLSRVKAVVGLLLALGVLAGATAGLAHQSLTQPVPQGKQPEKRAEQPKAVEEKTARLDGHGDALPEGAILRFGSARLRHGGTIYASALAPDGKTLATAGAHSVVVWNLDKDQVLHRLGCDHGNSFVGPGLTFSPDGTRLAYVRGTFFACVWDLRTGKELRRFERKFEDGLGKFFNAPCQFINQGMELVLHSREAIETWDVESGQMTASLPVEGARASRLTARGISAIRARRSSWAMRGRVTK
jgi:WD40 repeat protein